MKKILNKKATSIVEAMVVMMIIVSGVVGMYNILNQSTNLTTGVKNKIQAIQIARQGIEAFTNIRDTNWIHFSSDYLNCWNVLNYKSTCIGDTTTDYDIKSNLNYKIFLDNNNRWTLTGTTDFPTNNYTNSDYRNFYKIGLNNGIYSQSGITENLNPLFTRELNIKYLKDDLTAGSENDQKIKITSIVQWADNTSKDNHKIEIEQILSNWKSQK